MAYKDSSEIATNSNYALGEYSFRIERTSVPGSTNDKIEAICTDKDGKNARKSIQVLSSTQLDGWYVEANETEASVYVTIKEKSEALVVGDINATSAYVNMPINSNQYVKSLPAYADCTLLNGRLFFGTPENVSGQVVWVGNEGSGTGANFTAFTYNNKTVCVAGFTNIGADPLMVPTSNVTPSEANKLFWTLYYGNVDGETKTILVARFAINLEDAGGDGPGSDWDDPGDYDDDWEEGDPTHTLYVTITGALSGRHNDPIVDPSYSYIPSDKDTVKDYGCGGDGGHGGGGGAGASTVVIHKFATNQANSKEVTAIAIRHGYGSGGGKGGKGGDGCILVYY